jgi:sulfur-carrier protein
MSVKLVYFAWVRERIGKADEMFDPPTAVKTIGDLITLLAARDESYAYAFERAPFIRVAIDRKHAKHETLIADAREIAFFPPMTGG